MCEQCTTEAETYLSPIPDWILIRATRDGHMMKKGQWGLVQCNDPDFVWTITPRPDPLGELTGTELENMSNDDPKWQEYDAWTLEAETFRKILITDPIYAWKLVNSSIEAGYNLNEAPRFEDWLFDHLGKWIRDHQPFSHDATDEVIFEKYEKFGYGEPPFTRTAKIPGFKITERWNPKTETWDEMSRTSITY